MKTLETTIANLLSASKPITSSELAKSLPSYSK